MKKQIVRFILIGFLIFIAAIEKALPQVSFSYSTPPVYTYNSAITALSPTVTSGWYGTGSNFASVPYTDGCYYSTATGDVYTTSTSTNNGYIYNASGTLLFTQNGATYGYSYPEAIVADASGTTFVSNYNNGTVKKLTIGNVETSITGTGLTNPTGLAFDGSGNLYVTDQGTGDVYKIASGATTASVFLTGFNNPWGIAIDASGDIFVSQTGTGTNNIIEVANAVSGGTTKTTFATGFNSPRYLAFDAAGYLFVADCYNSAIKKISPGGTVTTVISSGLSTVVGITIDGSGDVYAGSYGLSEVLKFVPLTYSISPALPAGLSINSYTGVISGTPTACSPATTYTVTANNGTNSGTATVNITVNPTAPTGTGATVCGSGQATLTASGSLPSGGTYNWYAASTGGSSLATGTSYTTPTIITTTTYYVAYTSNGATSTPRTAVTATVSSSSGPVLATVPTSGAYFSYSFTGGSLTDQTGNGNTAIAEHSPTTTTDRFGVANSAYYFNGSYQYITTTTQYASPGPSNFSISLWFKTTVGGGKLIGFGSSQTDTSAYDDRNIYIDANGYVYFGIYPSPTQTLTTLNTYNDGNWHNVVATQSTTAGANLYIDGQLQAGDPTMTTCQVLTGYWRIAFDRLTGWPSAPATLSQRFYTGAIDDIAVYNTVLSAAQIYAAYGAGSSAYCVGNPLTLQVNTVTGASYSWTGPNSFTSAVQNPTVTSSATAANAGTYTCNVTNSGGCSSVISVTVPNILAFNWTGANSTAPGTAGNWVCTTGHVIFSSTIPSVYPDLPRFDGSANLVIPNGLTNYPSLTANISSYGLNIGSTASVNLNGYTLSVGCNLVNSASTSGTSGILYGNNIVSGLTWNGSVASQTYTGTNTASTAEIGNMTLNNSAGATVTITGGPVDIHNVLTLTQGNLAIGSSPALLTLISTATQTASVAAITSGYAITGSVNVQRYVSGSQGYKLLSCPVNDNQYTSSSGNVVDLSYIGSSATSPDAYSGAFFAGPGTGFGSGSIHYNANPVMYLYQESLKPGTTYNSSFTSGKNVGINSIISSGASSTVTTETSVSGTLVTTPSVKVPAGNGYLLYYIGLNTTTNAYPSSVSSSTITASGYVNQGNVPLYMWGTTPATALTYTTGANTRFPGLTMIGNPYPATLNLSTFYTDNSAGLSSPTIYEFNDATAQFPTYNGSNGMSSTTPAGGSQYIASGQGFYVIAATTGTGTITFKESEKYTSTTSAAFPGTLLLTRKIGAEEINAIAADDGSKNDAVVQPANALTGLHLKLMKDSTNYDECGVYFNSGWSDAFDNNDSFDLDGISPKVYLSSYTSDDIRTSINALGGYSKGKRIKLYVNVNTGGLYTLNLEDVANIDTADFNIYLVDNLKKDSLDLVRYKTYNFNINTADTTTFGANRFVLAIEKKSLLPYQLISFTAQKVTGGVLLTWTTSNEGDYTGFAIQKQDGGNTQYNTLYSVQSDGAGTYSYIDPNPVAGNNTYRLMQNNIDSVITYTNPLNVLYTISTSTGVLSIYPNPAHETIRVNFNSATAANGTYQASIYNSLGSLMLQTTENSNSWTQDVSALKPGAYILTVTSSNGTVIGNSKFIKYQ